MPVLLTFYKVFENVIHIRLESAFRKLKKIKITQNGVKKNKSTEQGLINLKEKPVKNMKERVCAIGLFLYFKNAFGFRAA